MEIVYGTSQALVSLEFGLVYNFLNLKFYPVILKVILGAGNAESRIFTKTPSQISQHKQEREETR